MKINGKTYRSVWVGEDQRSIHIFNQEKLPYELEILTLNTVEESADAIVSMKTRGAPLLGIVGAYGLAFAMQADTSDSSLNQAYEVLVKTRPTAINLKWALDRVKNKLVNTKEEDRLEKAYQVCAGLCDEDVEINHQIGLNGLEIIEEIAAKKKAGDTINILTHCNAGWLATVDWGTALAPMYMAHDKGIKIHVWVDETRPRNQGALTSYELGAHGVDHTLIADNVGGHLMQHGLVDMVIVGTDRVTAKGDVCNKIGTYLKALAAHANDVPFYVALPTPTFDPTVWDGVKEIPIEQRSGTEQSHVQGIDADGKRGVVNTAPEGTQCGNYAFDVTPAKYVTALITERGVVKADQKSILEIMSKE
ncbi:S-methyl-5-thioribose-1-phosphate isomerase [Vibrio sp. 99-8-1]|uniref:S-methyl-5-thioribose-1-phosphate isomerase n=1 Tax=Vibrio sp. 99-8-1 TaxID=2607602 RepID=UPI0014935CF7|nr:S-methyl-5-thioribose-1-phosphate isomerase [Vibrio sp. 99-8-1]NOI67509.1 S-methyl-5-thioribose-1-phosphate isomerase [Vibrio sp. 99-8-1]